jgi:hypothetical protein
MRNGATVSRTSSARPCRNAIASTRLSAAVSLAIASIASSGSTAMV